MHIWSFMCLTRVDRSVLFFYSQLRRSHRVMDGGSFYQWRSSITSSLAGSFNNSSPYPSTSTPNSSLSDCPPYTADSYAAGPSIDQKIDQLLFLFNEERRETAELKTAVLKLKDQMEEIKEWQEKHATSEPTLPAGKGSYRIPPDLSVRVRKPHAFEYYSLVECGPLTCDVSHTCTSYINLMQSQNYRL